MDNDSSDHKDPKPSQLPPITLTANVVATFGLLRTRRFEGAVLADVVFDIGYVVVNVRALVAASRHGHGGCVSILLGAGTDIGAVNNSGAVSPAIRAMPRITPVMMPDRAAR